MTTFEYLAVLFSVVVGLAVTQTLRGLLRIVHHRRTVRIYWPTLIWTAALLQWTVFFWWFTGLDFSTLGEWRFSTLGFVLAYGAALYFLLGLLHPEGVGEDFDMKRHFERQRSWFFGVFVGVGLLDLGDTSIKAAAGTLTMPEELVMVYAIFMAIWMLGGILCLVLRDGRVAGTAGIVYFLFTIYVIALSPGMGARLGA